MMTARNNPLSVNIKMQNGNYKLLKIFKNSSLPICSKQDGSIANAQQAATAKIALRRSLNSFLEFQHLTKNKCKCVIKYREIL